MAGQIVTLRMGGAQVGTGTADKAGVVNFLVDAETINAGDHEYTATAKDGTLPDSVTSASIHVIIAPL